MQRVAGDLASLSYAPKQFRDISDAKGLDASAANQTVRQTNESPFPKMNETNLNLNHTMRENTEGTHFENSKSTTNKKSTSKNLSCLVPKEEFEFNPSSSAAESSSSGP